jgi:hypothetical protein
MGKDHLDMTMKIRVIETKILGPHVVRNGWITGDPTQEGKFHVEVEYEDAPSDIYKTERALTRYNGGTLPECQIKRAERFAAKNKSEPTVTFPSVQARIQGIKDGD